MCRTTRLHVSARSPEQPSTTALPSLYSSQTITNTHIVHLGQQELVLLLSCTKRCNVTGQVAKFGDVVSRLSEDIALVNVSKLAEENRASDEPRERLEPKLNRSASAINNHHYTVNSDLAALGSVSNHSVSVFVGAGV